MRTSHFRRFVQRHVAWLLCIALFVPIAQSAAMGHTVSHLRADKVDRLQSAAQPLDPAHCVLCLAGEALSGSAIAGAPPPLLQPRAPHEVPHAALGRTWLAPIEPPYRSRAPPFAPH